MASNTWLRKFGRWAKKKGDQLGKWIQNTLGLDDTISNTLKKTFDNTLNSMTGNGMTDAQKEEADLQLENQRTLNEEEFDRKIDFYERFESPEAQVRQYKAAGLNPMLLAGGARAGASASGGVGSAGSAAGPSSSPDASALLSTILAVKQFKLQQKRADAEVLNLEARTNAQRIENKWNERLKELQARETEQRINVAITQEGLNKQTLQKLVHETMYAKTMSIFAPALFQSQIDERESSAYQARMSGLVSEARIAEINTLVDKHKAETDKINAEIPLIAQQIKTLASQESLNDARAAECRQNIKESIERVKKIGKEIGLIGKDLEYYLWNHAKQVGLGPVRFPVTAEVTKPAANPSSGDDIDLFDMVD